ncbi:MAG: radical SAM/SPASM domain-containing protein [Acidobacteriota bacterium]
MTRFKAAEEPAVEGLAAAAATPVPAFLPPPNPAPALAPVPAVKTVPGRIGELVRFPLKRIHIELTNVCNFDCTFCPKQNMTRKYAYMDAGVAFRIIDQIAEYHLAEKITFHVMGEPFMHPRFFDILDYAARLGVPTGITTNGTYLNEEISARLAEVTVTQMNISLQTPDPESFKTRLARRMEFREYKERILSFIAACLRHRNPPTLKVHFLNTHFRGGVPGLDGRLGTMRVIDSRRELRDTFRYWAAAIHAVCPSLSAEESAAVNRRIDHLSIFAWNVVKIAPHVFFETYVLDTWGNAFVPNTAVVPSKIGYCSALTDHFAILCDGSLTYCCKDFDGNTRVGNIMDQPIVALLNSEPVIDAIEGFKRFQVRHPYCQKCLGGSTRMRAFGNSFGSIVIWKILKNLFYRKG